MEFRIKIDQTRKSRQVAEIAQADYFQQLLRQAREIRNSFETDPEPQAEAETPEASIVWRGTVGSQPPDPPVLRLIHSSAREFHLAGGGGYIGRREPTSRSVPEIDLKGIPDDGIVSRAHARIYWDWNQNSYILVDNNSLNGTYLNGNLLTPGVDYRLNHGDSLHLGQNNLVCFTVSVTRSNT